MSNADEFEIAELVDRDKITRVLFRYCRAIDRCDKELLRSVYHSDARDDHGIFSGLGWDFAEFVIPLLEAMGPTSHVLTNCLIEVEDDNAYSESYVTAFHSAVPAEDGGIADIIAGGRYVDRFERRKGEWRIADRVVVVDWNQNFPVTAKWDGPMHGKWRPRGERGRSDRSYGLKGPSFGSGS
jgi:hypothetical protein